LHPTLIGVGDPDFVGKACFTVTSGTPKALEIWLCEALPLAMSWLVKNRNDAISSTGRVKTGR
jgi:hypothetical protein